MTDAIQPNLDHAAEPVLAPPAPRRVATLELDQLDRQCQHRLLVEIVEDGLGQSIRIPVIVIRGKANGPTFGITAALHGNELNGIPVIHQVVGMLPARKVPDSPLPIICESSRWLYTDRGGLLTILPDVTEFVARDQVIARQTNVFGDLIREYRSPSDGVVIGHSTGPVSQTGARIVHLGSLRKDAIPVTVIPSTGAES